MDENKIRELKEAEDMAYFRADLCLYSPDSYTLDEKVEICNEMASTSRAIVDAMREDFNRMPPELQERMLEELCRSGVESPEWWSEALTGEKAQ